MLNIVSTPIGNLDDLSIRQAKTLLSSDIILAEDTRSSQIILEAIKNRFTLSSNKEIKIMSYYKEKEFEKLPEIIDYLKEEKIVSLISDSGTPLISDPGFLLVKTCIKEKIPITHIPGPSAVISSVVMSGFNPKEFMFLGFLPKKQNDKLKVLKKMLMIKEILKDISFIFYESPNRINETINCFESINWNPDIAITRELTKKFEEVIRGKPKDLLKKEYKGEITVVVK